MKKKIYTTAIVANSLVVLIFIFLTIWHQGPLLSIRQAIFATVTNNPEVFKAAKATAVKKYHFITENKSTIKNYTQKIINKIDFITPQTISKLQIPNIALKAQLITLLFSKNGGEICGEAKGLIHKIQKVSKGIGCCSDHAEAFIALSHILGLNTREVYHSEHTTTEVYDPSKNKWLWVDTQFAIMAKDTKGNYLSLIEIMERMNKEKPVNYLFFGNENHTFKRVHPQKYPYYNDKNDFEHIMLTLGDNVFTQDIFNKKLIFLPKPIRQMILLAKGIQPKYIIYATEITKTQKQIRQTQIILILLSVILSIINVLALLTLCTNMIKRLRKKHNKVN